MKMRSTVAKLTELFNARSSLHSFNFNSHVFVSTISCDYNFFNFINKFVLIEANILFAILNFIKSQILKYTKYYLHQLGRLSVGAQLQFFFNF